MIHFEYIRRQVSLAQAEFAGVTELYDVHLCLLLLCDRQSFGAAALFILSNLALFASLEKPPPKGGGWSFAMASVRRIAD